MKYVTVVHDTKTYYWWFENVFTSNIRRARKCSRCVALDFVVNTKEMILIDEDAVEEVAYEEFVIIDE